MRQLLNFLFRNLNGYSWSIIVAYIGATTAMEYHSDARPLEGFFVVLPLIAVLIFWSQRAAPLMKKDNDQFSKEDSFYLDLFVISFSFILAGLFSFMFEYNNSDIREWWSLIIYFLALYGLIFSLVFSLIAILLPKHKLYTKIFATIILLFAFDKFSPQVIPVLFFGKMDVSWIFLGSLITVHLVLALAYKLQLLIRKKGK